MMIRDSQYQLKNWNNTSVKYDFLLTSVQDIIIQTIRLLQQDNLIEKNLSLREIYNKYLHPSVLPIDDKRMYEALANNEVICCFQFDSAVGAQAAKKIRPSTPIELADANGLMRLMPSEKGAEAPLDKYVRFKNNIRLWYKEMDNYGLTKEEQKSLEPHFLSSYGVPPSQEQLMRMLMDPDICGFTLAEANSARKVVAKKQMSKIPELEQKVYKSAKSINLGKYVWKFGLGPQMGYSFSVIHSLAYSFIGLQTLYLATHFDPIYWDTACLIVNSGSIEGSDETTDYAKIARAIGAIRQANIKISLIDINRSSFGFKPDVENKQILFGLKSLVNVGDDLITKIIENRPYKSPRDFINKVHPNKSAMISLIKSGAFDNMIPRKICLVWYLWEVCDRKSKLNMQNMSTLLKNDLIPEDTEDRILARRVYEFNRYLKANCKMDDKNFLIDERALNFLLEINCSSLLQSKENLITMNQKVWDKTYQAYMDIFREFISSNQQYLLNKINNNAFLDEWNKYSGGNNESSWEMETMCFYYHSHELSNINYDLYGIDNFFELPEEPEVERSFFKNNHEINLYKIRKICGTCIAKNKTKSTISLLTPSGVVEVKFRKEHFSLFDKQISIKDENGIKHVIEKGWFRRGSMIIVQGIRQEDNFIAKKYNSTPGHTLYHITNIYDDGSVELKTTRAQGDEEESED